jgi:ATP-binding cassette subfamily B multidrug efflux pump
MKNGKFAHGRGHLDRKPNTAQRHEALSFLLSYVKRHIWSVASGVVLLIFVDFIQLIIPKFVQRTIDILGNSAFADDIIVKNAIIILALASGMVLIRFFWRVLIMGSARKVEREVRQDMFSHLQKLGFNYFNTTQTGSIMALMINDVKAIRMAAGPSFIALTDALFMGSLSLFFMFSINVKLSLLTILPLPIILFMIARYGPLIQSRFRAVQESFAEISSRAQESFSGIRVLKGFVQEESEISKFDQKCSDYVEKNLKLIRVWGLFFPSITLLASLSLALLYLIGGRFVVMHSITFGEFVSFAMYINLLVWPVIAIGWVFNILQRGIASSKRILELLHTQPDVYDATGVDLSIKHLRGEIEIKDLSFRYTKDGRSVLRDINLLIPEGTSLGIMGKPGSGKSTLVSLLFRLFPLEKNRIFIDRREIHEIPLAILRRSIGYVPQDSFLFSDTISHNIAFGLDAAAIDEGEIERMAWIVSIEDEIMAFKDHFDTRVGERGITLSGGQKQRLSIARALIIKPQILILDDAFSAVDVGKETQILKNIHPEMKDRTRIIISHRVSTVKDCDNIIVLDGGRIIEMGSHDELLELSGYYKGLFELQKLEEQIA